MSRVLKDTFLIPKAGPLSRARFRSYATALWTIICLHFFAIAVTLFATFWRNDPAQNSIAYFFTLLQGLSVASGLLIVLLSLKSEALISQTYDFAVSATQAASHQFSSFSEHLNWLKDNLSPERFPETQHLAFSVSTPLYGIGAQDGSVDEFLDYLESWVKHFEETSPHENPHPPIWELAFWNKEDNTKTFGENHFAWSNEKTVQGKERYCKLLERMYRLYGDQRVDLRLYFTDVSHSRLFLVETRTEKCGGMLVLFTPLTTSSIETKQWTLVGFSFRDKQAFQNIARFNLRLQKLNHRAPRPENHVETLKNPVNWLDNHYSITGVEDEQSKV